MKKILTLLAVFTVLFVSLFAETIGDNPEDPFERDRWEREKLTTQVYNLVLKDAYAELGLKESEIDKNATIKAEYMPMHDEIRIYYDTLYVTFAEGEAMNAVMAYVQKFIRDNKYYQYKYMEKDKTKPYKDDRKQRKVVYSSHIKLVR